MRKRTIATVVLWAFAIGGPHRAVYAVERDSSFACKLLDESYASADALQGQQRADFLARFTRVASAVGHKNAGNWCLELFKLGLEKLPVGKWEHLQAQKNAVVSLAAVDPEKALDLLSRMADETPVVESNGLRPEDVRADAAIAVFPKYVSVVGVQRGIQPIASVATATSRNGQYPYHAMSLVLNMLAQIPGDESRREATNIFREGFDAYKASLKTSVTPETPPFLNNDYEFLELLQSAQFLSSASNYEEAVHFFTKHLIDAEGGNTGHYIGSIQAGGRTIGFQSRARLLLFREFPMVAKIDKRSSEQLQNNYPELQYALDEVTEINIGVIQGKTPTQSDVTKLTSLMDESALRTQINYVQESNPRAALELIQRLPAASRPDALSEVLPAIANTDLKQAQQIYEQQKASLESIKDAGERLDATVFLAKAAWFVHDSDGFVEYATAALSDGEDLFVRSKPAGSKPQRDFIRPGYSALTDVVSFGMQHKAPWLLDDVRRIKDPTLKAYLLLFAADGVSKGYQ